MKHALALSTLLALSASVPAFASSAPREDKLLVDKDWLALVPWRSIGPANMGGRITAIAAAPNDPYLYWIATASGGLLKSADGGITYEHQFDHESTVSIGAVAVAASDPQIVWVGTGESNPRNSVSYGDGVYKSTDGGKTWKRMGLDESFQIGGIAIHPQDPEIVYVGALGRLYGPSEERGLFKTTDGGKHWEKVLYVDERTGVVDVDMNPADPETLLVAAYERERDGFDTNDPSKKWGPGSGIYKTTDGGKSWKKLDQGLPTVQLGRIGIDYYGADPSHVYAVIETERIARLPDDAAWAGFDGEDAEVGAKVTRIDQGSPAESAGLQKDDVVLGIDEQRVYSWDQLVHALRERKSGESARLEVVRKREPIAVELALGSMPERETERSPFSSGLGGQRENVQGEQGREAIETGGVFESTDGGETWTRINSLNPRPMYFSEIRVDPSDENYVYVLGISLYRSKDGGKTFTADGAGDEVHVDHHALWVDPRDGRHMLLGNDGGIYETRDRMEHWDHHAHVAIGQFYHVAVDSRDLYKVYGGLQDNGSWGGPNRTRDGGTVNEDWFRIGGGDGFVCRVDSEDPDLVYSESQNGGIGRFNLRTGERSFLRPRGREGVRYRFNWETPFVVSSHHPRVFYSAGNYVFRSPNEGDDLEPISPEITLTDKGSATTLEESPKDSKLLYVGTDDGALWSTRDGGATWIDLFDPWASEVEEARAERRTRALDALVKRLDANGDGRVEKGEVPKELEGFFADADLDGNGELDAEELRGLSGAEAPPEEEAAPAPPAAPDLVSGRWKARLTSGGTPEESSRFELELALKPDGSVTGRFETATKKGEILSGKYDLTAKALELEYEMEVGRVRQTGTIEGAKLSGALQVGEGVVRVDYEAEREGGPGGAPAASPASSEPWSGEWEARLVGEGVPPDSKPFSITLRPGAGGRIEGRVTAPVATGDALDASFDARTGALAFDVETGGSKVHFQAKVEADGMKGSFASGLFTMQFEAKRLAPAPPPASRAGREAREEAESSESSESAQEAGGEEDSGAPARRERRPRKPKKHATDRTLAALLPKRMWVSSIEVSRHDASRVYVVFDGHRSDDDRPYVFVSEDRGETWTELSAKLPRGSSRVLREDLANPDLLYLGTEFGAWLSFDRGTSWQRMPGLPTVAVHDFAQHPTNGDVVVATHGRSLWVFDASFLRQITAKAIAADAHLYAPNKLIRWGRLPSRGESGTRRFVGQNGDGDLRLFYSLADKPSSVRLTIEGLGGETVRELEADAKRGIHVVTWDGRREGRAPREGREGRGPRPGPRVPAGHYLAVLEVDGRRFTQHITIEDDPDPAASDFAFEEENERLEAEELGLDYDPDR